MKPITVKRDGQRDLKFEGELVCEVSNHSHQGPNQNRWTDLLLFKTASGKYVLAIKHITCWQGEENGYEAMIIAEANKLVDVLIDSDGGELTWLSKELLEKAGIDATEGV